MPERAYVEGVLGVYEFCRVDLLRDVFAWAYRRSCAQYRVVREAVGDPDPFRLRYRTLLAEVVRETVRRGSPPVRSKLRAWAQGRVTEGDLDRFAETALALLLALHDGSAARYGLTPSEFVAWRDRYRAPAQINLF